MVLGGLALAFSRLIDNSVVVLENIFRHLEMGEMPEVAAEERRKRSGASGTGCDIHNRDRVFPGDLSIRREPVSVHCPGRSVVFSLFASYAVAMTVVPLFCARFIHRLQADEEDGHSTSAVNLRPLRSRIQPRV